MAMGALSPWTPCTNSQMAPAMTTSSTSSTGIPGNDRIGFSFMAHPSISRRDLPAVTAIVISK